ncbi:porin family protein [uncultured Winogradskyella sp.]|uniref:porin family protein n=1 Tax=uncultured Winogradskyella sp. TaxID=395353 RepID=UPI0026270B17|nr:porin family protein [uncultured Winogradskyella sp.]
MRIVIILFVLFSFSLNAQRNPIGIKVGSNLSNIVGDNTQDVSFSVRPHFGLYMEILIDDFGAFQPELVYTSYGYTLDAEGKDPNIGLNYLALTVLSKMFLFKNFSIDVGPQVGILLSAKDKEDVISNVESDFYNRDFGVNTGISYHISKKIIASFRYYIGLTDVTVVKTKNFNRSFQIAFQYKIN